MTATATATAANAVIAISGDGERPSHPAHQVVHDRLEGVRQDDRGDQQGERTGEHPGQPEQRQRQRQRDGPDDVRRRPDVPFAATAAVDLTVRHRRSWSCARDHDSSRLSPHRTLTDKETGDCGPKSRLRAARSVAVRPRRGSAPDGAGRLHHQLQLALAGRPAVIALPAATDAKPHCGLSASRSSGT